MASENEEPNVDQLLKVSEVAKMFNVTSYTVREWLREGIIQGVKIGKGYYWRVPASSVAALAQKRHGDSDDK